MIVEDLHERIWTARVVDVVRSVAAATPVETPTIVYFTNPQHFAMSAPARFGV